jgi:RNA polymerase sigma-70 factor (ECF subfamily)
MGMGEAVAMVDSAERQYQLAYDRFAGDVFRFVLAWTNDWTSAEDLTQETYLRLWQHRASIDWDRPIIAWLLVTARRLANNRFRALRRRLAPTRSALASDELVRVRWLDVREALGTLTPLERTALITTAVEGWSYAEVANVLKTTEGALRAAVSRARDKLEVA